jgi:hypothetical protein
MTRAGHVACTGQNRKSYKVFVGKVNETDRLEKLGVRERKMLKWILNK